MKRSAIIFLMLGMLFPPAAFAQGARCAAPEIDIKTQVPATNYSYDKNVTAIQLMLREGGRTYAGYSDDWVLSVTLAKPMFTVDGEADGSGCLKAVRVVFGFENMDVLIANDFKPGTCAFKALNDHEYEHVTINTYTLEDYAKNVRSSLQEVAGEKGPQALTPYRDKLEQAVADFEKRLRNREVVLDTPQNYDRMIAKCEDWNQSYTWASKRPVQRAPAQGMPPKPPKAPVIRAPSAPMP